MKTTLTTFSLAALALSACQSETPRLDVQLGKSVAELIQAQTYDPNAAANPPALAPEGGDGPRLKNVVDAHRKDVPAGATQVSQSPAFEVGKQQQ